MDEPLKIGLTLDQNECIRGESVYFEVTLENVSPETITDFPNFDPYNRTVSLEVEGREGRQKADALTSQERDGKRPETPEPVTISFAPKAKLDMRDDMLTWFAELSPGDYKVTATYEGKMLVATSDPIKLRVTPAKPVMSSTPRYGAQMTGCPLSAAWVHETDKKALLFYQQQSLDLPRNPRHGIRAAQVDEPEEILAAVVSKPDVTQGHLAWVDPRGKLFATAFNLGQPKMGTPVELKPPFAGKPLPSPQSMPDGSMFLPFVDAKRQRFAALHVDPQGQVKPYELDLGKAKPIGPYVCFWDYDARLHFLWTKENGRQVQYARLVLADPDAGFATKSAYLSNHPITWFDAYLDLDAAFGEQPYFTDQLQPGQADELRESSPPPLILWCVAQRPGSLLCTKVDINTGQAKPGVSLGTLTLGDVRVVHSVVTFRHELAMLLAESSDKLHYASTGLKSVTPLSKAAGKDIELDQDPGLMTAGEGASEPWVYVRYVDNKEAIAYARLEPSGEQDPVERLLKAAGAARRRKGR